MDIIILEILVLIFVLICSCFIQIHCIKSRKKIVKAAPTICTIILAIIFAIQDFSLNNGGTFFGLKVQSPFDILALAILEYLCIAALIGAALGVALAWITHGIKYMLQKRPEKI